MKKTSWATECKTILEYDFYCAFSFVENVDPAILPDQVCPANTMGPNPPITCAPTSHPTTIDNFSEINTEIEKNGKEK